MKRDTTSTRHTAAEHFPSVNIKMISIGGSFAFSELDAFDLCWRGVCDWKMSFSVSLLFVLGSATHTIHIITIS